MCNGVKNGDVLQAGYSVATVKTGDALGDAVDTFSCRGVVVDAAEAMHAAIGHTRIRRVHTPTRIHNHPNRVQLRMRRPKNILVPVKEQARRIEVVLRVLRVPDLILQSRLGQLHGLLVLFRRLDELGVDVCGDHGQEPRRAAHRHRGVAPEGLLSVRCSPRSGGCSSARGCPSTQGTTSPGDVRSRATTRRSGHLVSTREVRELQSQRNAMASVATH